MRVSGPGGSDVEGMLTGVVVLELGQVIAGTYAGLILADLGAEVIKIEPLSGDTNRNAHIVPVYGESAVHLSLNRNKKSVAVNLKDPDGLDLFYRLVDQADVVIDNFRPGVLKRLKVDHETLTARNPKIITASVTGFGEYGPMKDRPAFDLAVQAIAGHLHITGDPEGQPARIGVPLADLAAGLFTCLSVLAALAARGLHGTGGIHADVAMLDSLVSMLGYDAVNHLNSGANVRRQGTAHAYLVPWQAFEVKDGYVVVAVRDDKFWRRLAELVGRPDLADDPRTATNRARVANREFVTELLETYFAGFTRSELMGRLDEFDIPAAPVNDLAAVFADPQVQARGIVREYHHPAVGTVRYPASPMQYAGWTFPNAPAPVLAEHTEEVLADRLHLDPAVVADLAARGVVGVAQRSWDEADARADH